MTERKKERTIERKDTWKVILKFGKHTFRKEREERERERKREGEEIDSSQFKIWVATHSIVKNSKASKFKKFISTMLVAKFKRHPICSQKFNDNRAHIRIPQRCS